MSPSVGDRKNCVNCDGRMAAVYARTSSDAAFRDPQGNDSHLDQLPDSFSWLCDDCGFHDPAPRFGLQPDPESPDRWIVKDAADVFVGAIDLIGASEWQNSYPKEADGRPNPVPIGPFKTLEAAFEAFQRAL